MKQVYRFDNNYIYKEPVVINDNDKIPSNCTSIRPPDGLFEAKFYNGEWIEGLPQDQISQLTGNTLDDIKQSKITEITNAQQNADATFQSSALGSVHTYLSDEKAMGKFNAEYTYVNSSDYDGQPILWYTIEEGGVNHTKDQFNQVWLEGRNIIANNFKKWDSLVKEIKGCTSVDEVNTIAW